MTVPDPKDKTFIGDVEVPYGKPVKSDLKHSSLLYNEYPFKILIFLFILYVYK